MMSYQAVWYLTPFDKYYRDHRALKHYGSVDGDDGAGAEREQDVVELDDLSPVGRCGSWGVGVDGGDCRLHLVRPWPVRGEARPHDVMPFVDQVAVPPVTVLIGEEYEVPLVIHAGGGTRLGEQQQREEARDFDLVGQQIGEKPPEADRFGCEIAMAAVSRTRRVGRRVDQVHRGQDGFEPFLEPIGRWDAVGGARIANLRLGPTDPLAHGGRGNEECVGDLLGGQPAEEAQCERDLCVGMERRMTAEEDQPELVVGDGVEHVGSEGWVNVVGS